MYKLMLLTYNKFIVRSVSTTPVCNLIQSYRKRNGLPLNPNASGPLTDLPDYSYLDGRPTPLGMKQRRRKLKQQEYARKILMLTSEIDHAVKRHGDMINAEQKRKDDIIANKLKPKGLQLKG